MRKWCSFTLTMGLLSLSPLASANHGFSPGLWMVTTRMTSPMSFVNTAPVCMPRLTNRAGPQVHAQIHVPALGPSQADITGPMHLTITRHGDVTTVTGNSRLALSSAMGKMVMTQRLWEQFTGIHHHDTMKGTFLEQDASSQGKSTLQEVMHGHWVAATCPAAISPPR